ncbi:2-oxoacid:acceptor oxidoreductase subunit alpha [Candidatus Karelsulcia muelleri]|uniref:2-oxoacid:acceptor oxidoreductase subunit alpha n=1 Tax=Candidatus Karelsulcia muelleri TaxID=336810 RepID=UPI001951D46C|nr:2-oxoacid:acceptor oxidoreductase subunit alpha [Candidatus Karelsulcia muelleri]
MKNFSILFSGNSGDGIQSLGKQFTLNCFNYSNYLNSSSEFPSEIRTSNNTIESLSSFKVNFGDQNVVSLSHRYDVLVVFNASALKANLANLKNGGIIIAEESGFLANQLKIACYTNNPLIKYVVYILNLNHYKYKDKEKDKYSKNMLVLGFLSYLFHFNLLYLLKTQINNNFLKWGYELGKTKRLKQIEVSKFKKKKYNPSNGNQAIVFGILKASQISKVPIFYSYYPITPATSILNYINKYKKSSLKIFLSEDEMSSISSSIGASYAGYLGITATSGPGMSLILEGIGLCFMLELPLLIINVQRAGPSTGLPTKTEQSDLLQALYGCHGETNIPVLAAKSIENCFNISFIACKIALEYMTPVVLLSDFYLANSFEFWSFKNLENIICNYPFKKKKYNPYERNKNKVRFWGIPGKIKCTNIIGGLEKKNIIGDVSFDSQNHELMVKLRKNKINNIRYYLPRQKINLGKNHGKILIISWGSTYQIINNAVKILISTGYSVSSSHFEFLNPLPNGINKFIYNFEKVVIAELNTGQFSQIIRNQFLINVISINKIQASQFTVVEIVNKIKELINT